MFQFGFWCGKKQVWSTHQVDWEDDIKNEDIFMQRRLYIDEAHTALDIFRFAVFFSDILLFCMFQSILKNFGVYVFFWEGEIHWWGIPPLKKNSAKFCFEPLPYLCICSYLPLDYLCMYSYLPLHYKFIIHNFSIKILEGWEISYSTGDFLPHVTSSNPFL